MNIPTCIICGTAHVSCGGPSAVTPVDLPSTSTRPQPATVRVDRGDGVLFKYSEPDAQAYIAAHPGAFLVQS